MKKMILTVTTVAAMLTITACGDPSAVHDDSEYGYQDDGSGVGMTYNGKMGFELTPGYVVPFDGSAPGFGYGF